MPSWLYLFLYIGSFSALSGSAAFAGLEDGPVSGGLGGAGVAAIVATEGGNLNPAVLPHLSHYHIAVHYADSQNLNAAALTRRGVAITDATADNSFPASLAYVERFDQLGLFKQKTINLAIGRLVSSGIAVGGFLRHTTIEEDSNSSESNVGTGFLFTPIPQVTFGCVLKNLIKKTAAKPDDSFQAVAGLHYSVTHSFRVRFDLEHITGAELSNNIMAGFETLPLSKWPIRFGLRQEPTRVVYTMGTGWLGPRLAFDYAYQVAYEPTYYLNHFVDVKLHF